MADEEKVVEKAPATEAAEPPKKSTGHRHTWQGFRAGKRIKMCAECGKTKAVDEEDEA